MWIVTCECRYVKNVGKLFVFSTFARLAIMLPDRRVKCEAFVKQLGQYLG